MDKHSQDYEADHTLTPDEVSVTSFLARIPQNVRQREFNKLREEGGVELSPFVQQVVDSLIDPEHVPQNPDARVIADDMAASARSTVRAKP